MIVITGLKFRFSALNIMFEVPPDVIEVLYMKSFSRHSPLKGQFGGGVWLLFFAEKVFVEARFNCSHIGHATVVDFQGNAVAYFP